MGGWRRRYFPSRRRQNARRGDGREEEEEENSASASEFWPPAFKSWEEEFCFMAGVSWRKLSETKKLLPFYKKIIQWDDSAAHEAFNKAKARFYAQINGLQYSMPSADPNEFLDEIDWYATTDPELLMDLEEPRYPILDDKDGKPTCQRSAWDSYSSGNAPIPCMGWADIDDPGSNTAWGSLNKKNDRTNVLDSPTGWGNGALKDNLRGNGNDTWRRWEQIEDKTWEQWQNWQKDADLNYHSEIIEKCGKKREGGRRHLYSSRGKKCKYSINCPANNSCSSFRGRKRPNRLSEERSYNKRQIEDQNYLHSCRPADRRGCHEDRSAWSVWYIKKPVS